MAQDTLHLRYFPRIDYQDAWQAMQRFTLERDNNTADELWLLEHSPVYTLGQAGKEEHILNPGDIPIVHCDRGGQVTYHGPGQIVVYLLIDLQRKKMGPRALVTGIENALVNLLAELGLEANARPKAPGVYVDDERKVASLGLRIKNGRSYHGLALNHNMDMMPFFGINPCGYESQPMTSLVQENITIDRATLEEKLLAQLRSSLSLTQQIATFDTLPCTK